MAENSKIEWTDHTFNPWVGCTKISPACDNCYAATWAKRAGTPKLWQGQLRLTSAANWRQPLKWNMAAAAAGKRAKVFCASLADVFDNKADPQWRSELFDLIERTPDLDWLLLTKRPQNMEKMIWPRWWDDGMPRNVWLGTTVENQIEADRRIPHLLNAPAAVRFLSCEPLLELVDLTSICTGSYFIDALGGWKYHDAPPDISSSTQKCARLDWVICGGESGPGARPMHPAWARHLRRQCETASTPFFFKQWGDWHPDSLLSTNAITGECPPPKMKIGKKRSGRLLDGREHNDFPAVR